MKLDGLLPPLPLMPSELALVADDLRRHYPRFAAVWLEWVNKLNPWGLACARAGALAALDEAIKECEQQGLNFAKQHIRRLRDTIMEGK